MRNVSRLWIIAAACTSLCTAPRPAAALDTVPKPGLAYEEIARVIPPGATPPPIGSFQDDAAAAAAAPPVVIPKDSELRLGTIKAAAMIPGIAGFVLSKAAEFTELARWRADQQRQKDEYEAALAARQKTGVLVKYAYLGAWKRIDFTALFAMIAKPDQGVTMTIDGDKKTYHTAQTAAGVETYTVQSGRATVITPAIVSGPTVEDLPAVQSAGVVSKGYRTSGSIDVAMSTFLCTAGRHDVVETEYVADVADPQYDAQTDFTNTKPLVGACGLSGAVSHHQPGRLVVYRATTVDPGTPGAFTIVVERGNVRMLDEKDTAMFQPPAGFTEAQ